MNPRSRTGWIAIVLVFLGVFGAAVGVTGLVVGLPAPAAGGTCGPGTGSEAAIVALFDPITIGAGPEPPATDAAGRAQWSAFVNQCQTAANNRAFVAFPTLVVSAGIAILGYLVFRRRSRHPVDPHPEVGAGGWSPSPWAAPSAGPSPYAVGDQSWWAPAVAPSPPALPSPNWPTSGSP
jgi:hypothetical protein